MSNRELLCLSVIVAKKRKYNSFALFTARVPAMDKTALHQQPACHAAHGPAHLQFSWLPSLLLDGTKRKPCVHLRNWRLSVRPIPQSSYIIMGIFEMRRCRQRVTFFL